MSTPVLALDTSKSGTGWAMRLRSGEVRSGVQGFPSRRGDSPGMLYLRFRAWLRELLEGAESYGACACGACPRGLVAYEQPHQRGGHATEIAMGLVTEVQAACAEFGVAHTSCHTATLKKHATGNGRAEKAQMIAAARARWGREPADDNEADALCLLAWALDEIGEAGVARG